ncbi:MAG: tRNA 2-selenouridine(34) synthase MnmH [Gudongella sp.]|jgi:tRNA 2-selenouridine synthase|nr:tRNA 2-selenouridine(34) synthase MnmH [Gudongella sp.]
MYTDIKYEELLTKFSRKEYLLIDVRTPLEYMEETIPGSINLPVFSNEERAAIGTAYAKESVEKAKQIGVEAISKRLPDLFSKILELNREYANLIFFCSRGGFRSSSIVALLKSLKINVLKLDGGYKGYRGFINNELPKISENVRLVVLYGNTGTGKTHILSELRSLEANVIDLEQCANHRGSILGSVGIGKPNSQKMFESLLYDEISKCDNRIIFIEGESKRIGRSVIPDYFFEKIRDGIHVRITAPMNLRVENIMSDYVHDTDEELIEALDHLRKRLGNETIDNYIIEISKKNHPIVVEELMKNYYDPMYEHNKRNFVFELENTNSRESAKILLTKYDS